jgi:hypothetical protein
MRIRGVCAAVAGIVGAATAHALDEAGLLPGVHESEAVREALTPPLTVAWLAMAGGLAWLAARTRPVPVGGAAALLVAAVPEFAGRHDPEAMVEPGALAGAALQWLLLAAVLALAVLTDRQLSAAPLRRTRLLPIRLPQTPARRRLRPHPVIAAGRARAPPGQADPCFS